MYKIDIEYSIQHKQAIEKVEAKQKETIYIEEIDIIKAIDLAKNSIIGGLSDVFFITSIEVKNAIYFQAIYNDK